MGTETGIDIYSIPILSVYQPYAHLIVHGPKRVENRTWATKYRGWVGIHASIGKRYLADADHLFNGVWGAGVCGPRPAFVFGAVIGVARLVACVLEMEGGKILSAAQDDIDLAWVCEDPWFEGPVGWVFSEVRSIQPIVCRGERGLFRLRWLKGSRVEELQI